VRAFEIPRRRLDRLQVVVRLPDVQDELFAFFEPQLLETLPQPFDPHVHAAALRVEPDGGVMAPLGTARAP